MQAQNTFKIIFKHSFIYGLQRKLSLFGRVCNLIHFCKISFTDNVADVILATEVLKHSKIFQQLEPFLKWTLFRHFSHSTMRREYNHLIHESDHYTLLKIKILIAISTKFTAKYHRLRWFLQRNQVHLTVLHVNNFACTVRIVVIFEFVKFTLEKDEISLFCRF